MNQQLPPSNGPDKGPLKPGQVVIVMSNEPDPIQSPATPNSSSHEQPAKAQLIAPTQTSAPPPFLDPRTRPPIEPSEPILKGPLWYVKKGAWPLAIGRINKWLIFQGILTLILGPLGFVIGFLVWPVAFGKDAEEEFNEYVASGSTVRRGMFGRVKVSQAQLIGQLNWAALFVVVAIALGFLWAGFYWGLILGE